LTHRLILVDLSALPGAILLVKRGTESDADALRQLHYFMRRVDWWMKTNRK
jgi:hypothetical protein